MVAGNMVIVVEEEKQTNVLSGAKRTCGSNR